ncbi:NADP-dependent oxidoreductase [Limnohabitans sp. 2KL-51]|nr:NADP-dependent oxidoreductase [Limnohabitans sp. 2KL-51]
MTTTNRQVLLAQRPDGIPQNEHFRIVETEIPPLKIGEVLVRNEWLSVEPAMRGWVNSVGNYSKPVGIGEVMRSFAAGRIVASLHPDWDVGTPVTGMFGWQEYASVPVSAISRKVGEEDLPLSTSLGVMGINGVTAHYGLLEIGQPLAGQTVVVSTAAGAVGSLVGQIAKLYGCRTIGITGGETKRQLCLNAFGYDIALDYKSPDFESQLRTACENSVDIYFDNTSGAISDTVLMQLALNARVVICGTASIPSWTPPPQGPRVERHLLVKRARMQGFVIFDHDDHEPKARADIARWLREGGLQYREDILDGIENAPDAIAGLYRGENLGKRLIRLHKGV